MPPLLLRTVACALIGATAPAAADWRYVATPDSSEPLSPTDLVATRDGYAMIGSDPLGREWWLQVRADGSVVRRATTGVSIGPIRPDQPARLMPVSDGVFMLGLQCLPSLFDDDGTPRWRLAQALYINPPCARLAAARDPERATWVPGEVATSYRILADGQPIALAGSSVEWYALTPLSTSAAAYGLYVDPEADFRRGVGRLTPQGIAWRHDGGRGQLTDVQETADGDALVTGWVARSDVDVQALIERRAPDGDLRWQTVFDPGAFPTSLAVQAGDRFTVALTAFGLDRDLIIGFAGDGTERWRLPLTDARFSGFLRRPDGDPRAAPDDVAFFGGPVDATDPNAPAPVDRVVIVDADGRPMLSRPALGARTVALLRDGTLVNVEPDTTGRNTLKRYAADGAAMPVPDLRSALPLQYALRRSVLTADGASVLLEHDAAHGSLRLTEIGPDGLARWTRALPPIAQTASTALPVAVDARMACLGPLRAASGGATPATLLCVHREDGRTAFAAELPDTERIADAHATLRIGADGAVELVESNASALTRTRIAADGRIVWSEPVATLLGPPFASGGADGDPVFLVPSRVGNLELVTVGPGGASVQRIGLGVRREARVGLRRLADGGVLLNVTDVGRDIRSLIRIGADGAPRWEHRSTPVPLADARFDVAGDRVLIADGETDFEFGTGIVTVLDLATGAVRWQHAQRRLRGHGLAAVAIDAGRGHALVARLRNGQAMLTTYGLADGAVVSVQPIDCGDALSCTPRDVRATMDGSTRIVAERHDLTAGRQVQVSSIDMPMPQPVAQSGIAGTWRPRDLTGQGLVIEYVSSLDAIAGGWFTYVPYGHNLPGHQAWYSLQGKVPAGARAAALTIYTSDDGLFGRGAAGAPVVAGHAMLRLLDCDTAVLSYRFDRGPKVSGDVPLVRAAPASFDCRDADGVRPAPSGDVGPWGAWFDPASPGEGLLFDLQPPTAAGPGRFTGGWFTYDVGTADTQAGGYAQQRWFTLQGDFANAAGGTVTVPVYRTIGGGLDHASTRNTERVGDVTLRFESCERATLDYRFDNGSIAGAFAGRAGRMALVKVTPCANEDDHADAAARARPR